MPSPDCKLYSIEHSSDDAALMENMLTTLRRRVCSALVCPNIRAAHVKVGVQVGTHERKACMGYGNARVSCPKCRMPQAAYLAGDGTNKLVLRILAILVATKLGACTCSTNGKWA